MDSFMKSIQTNATVQAVLFILLGLVLLFVPGMTLVTIVYLVGSIFAVSGIVSLVAYFRKSSASYGLQGALTSGIFLIVIALVMFLFPLATAGFFTVLLGIVLILCGIGNTVRSFALRGFGGSVWIVSAVIGVLVAVGGVIIIWNPFETTVLFAMVLGAFLVMTGVSNLIVDISMRRQLPNS